MLCLFLESSYIAHLRYAKVRSKLDRFAYVYWSSLTNLGVLNANNLSDFLALEDDEAMKRGSTPQLRSSDQLKGAQKFIRRSSIITFVHHASTLSVIMALSTHYPEFFGNSTAGHYDNLILTPTGCHFYTVFGGTMVLGFYATILTLYEARMVVDVQKEKLRDFNKSLKRMSPIKIIQID